MHRECISLTLMLIKFLQLLKRMFHYFLILPGSSTLSLALCLTNTAHILLLLIKSKQDCTTYTQVYSLGFIIHLPIRQPVETMTPQTPIWTAW